MFVQPFLETSGVGRRAVSPHNLFVCLLRKNSATVRTIMYLNPLYNLKPFVVTTISGLGNSLLPFSLKLALMFGFFFVVVVLFNWVSSFLT